MANGNHCNGAIEYAANSKGAIFIYVKHLDLPQFGSPSKKSEAPVRPVTNTTLRTRLALGSASERSAMVPPSP
jgi:hypothetical protein